MNNDIMNFLNIEDKDIIITKIVTDGNTKEIHLEKPLKVEFCPACSSRMHSKGKYVRKINHPILQDGFQLKLIVTQRKWRCTNPQCNLYFNDQFNFISKYRQSSNITPYLILSEMKNIHVTTADAARRYSIFDTAVHYIFLQYPDIRRLPLPEIISVDEVFLDIDYRHRYALVMMDFRTSEVIDILPNRWEETTNAYFLSIPLEERRNVKYLICDMYDPYINYTKRYFPESTAIIDSYHVVSWIIRKISSHINDLKKKYQARDRKVYEESCIKSNRTADFRNMPISREVYLLNNFKWLILQNEENIDYQEKARYNHKLKAWLNTYDYEKMFFQLDDSLKQIRDLKEKYIEFNKTGERDLKKIDSMLGSLIDCYSSCQLTMFREFSELLNRHRQEIVNSFIYITDSSGNERRLSNGPMEGYNRTPKDFKRNSRGLTNFEYARSRLIWANRKNEAVLATPKSKKEVYKFKK